MLGFNGGLLGKRRIPSTDAAPGIWLSNECAVARSVAAWPSLVGTDPHFADVSTLLHMNGTSGSTSFPDSSSNANSTTSSGATVSTQSPKFGTGTAVMNAGRIRGTGGTLFIFPADFTIEFWVFPYENQPAATRALFGFNTAVDGILYSYNNLTIQNVSLGTPSVLEPFQWHHLAIVRSSTTAYLFKNGIQDLTGTVSGTVNSTGARYGLGMSPVDATIYVNGKFDEFRVTKGVARYTANFTPPTAAFPDS